MTRNLIPTPIDIEAIRHGDRLGLTRLLTQVENESPQGRLALEEIFSLYGYCENDWGDGGTGGWEILFGELVGVGVTKKIPFKKNSRLGSGPRPALSVEGRCWGDRVRMRALSGGRQCFYSFDGPHGGLWGDWHGRLNK